jgi:hypothetical protein
MSLNNETSEAQEEDLHCSSGYDDSDWVVDELNYFSPPQQTFYLISSKAMFTTGYHNKRLHLYALTLTKAIVSGQPIFIYNYYHICVVLKFGIW